ncbi:hypothetical protein IAQ61_009789 [Plenodomus lingam]|uniref:uncharacterized protein n=1 Tax=Leptosphaeria maculans TaxID=5022 RepID=UPI003323CDE7|nr:hypothetical protein IAQ61_009789 [Plenodomus lingam]
MARRSSGVVISGVSTIRLGIAKHAHFFRPVETMRAASGSLCTSWLTCLSCIWGIPATTNCVSWRANGEPIRIENGIMNPRPACKATVVYAFIRVWGEEPVSAREAPQASHCFDGSKIIVVESLGSHANCYLMSLAVLDEYHCGIPDIRQKTMSET